jgi:hypothetical protein
VSAPSAPRPFPAAQPMLDGSRSGFDLHTCNCSVAGFVPDPVTTGGHQPLMVLDKRVAMRCEKTDISYSAIISFACGLMLVKSVHRA